MELSNFQSEMTHKETPLHALRMSLKSMAYIMDQLGGDFQQGSCLYKPTSGIQWISEHS